MNWNIPIVSSALSATVAVVASCSMLHSNGSGETIHNPTVDDMARLEAQWGMAPQAAKPRLPEGGAETPSAPAPGAAAAPVQAVQSQTPLAAPPLQDPVQPAAASTPGAVVPPPPR